MADYTLYAYFRSSCSARVRILLNLKNIAYDVVPVNLLRDEQLAPAYRDELNPSASVPLLVCRRTGLKISQSLAALEYLEEAHPHPHPSGDGGASALPPPSEPGRRAVVRVLCGIIAADVQPVTNLRIMKRVRKLGGDAEDWNRELMQDGLRAYEDVLAQQQQQQQQQDEGELETEREGRRRESRYSVGDAVTLADACLVPAVWNARRFGVDLAPFPHVRRVMANLEALDAVRRAEYFRQPDCPPELRRD